MSKDALYLDGNRNVSLENQFDDFGTELDAKFSVQPFQGGFDLVVESQGGSTGGQAARNVD